MAPSEYRFEDSPGLTLSQVNSNVVPHRCKTSNEQHHKRHSAIAALVKDINQKSNVKAPSIRVEKIANAIHGYSEASILNDRQALDSALAKDLDLGERITQIRGKTLNENLKDQEIRQILSRLGFDKDVSLEPNEQRAMLLPLVDAITSDIETVANESRETLKRQLGYYKYADKRAYNAITRNLSSLSLERGGEDSAGDSETSAAAEEVSEEESQEEEGAKEDPTTNDAVPDPKPEGKENNDVKVVNTSAQRNDGMKLIFVSNRPKRTAFPEPRPLREKNV
ncbi:hypothetical protein UA08_07166 [Talaromyces atroroseus]|uniref:Uncharacterized protein n=1 Tax=Talaromyces atroroseus TaxID=1441469 RepID=A0A225AR78_TALAT|nr:hypothetical protein UA08_07166 [Talaromyces atroroseus]OKL57446.1 hypothetical protein UA08_07166 [Talaromyces atroroseus]